MPAADSVPAARSFEELTPALAVAPHDSTIEVLDEIADAGVESGEGVEDFVADASEDPSLHDLHCDFDLGLVARLACDLRDPDGRNQ